MSVCRQYPVWFVIPTHFYDFPSINKTHGVITKTCIYSQSYPETIGHDDKRDHCWGNSANLTGQEDSITTESATWKHLPSHPPSSSFMYHLNTLRDIRVYLVFNPLLFCPKEMTWILTQFEMSVVAVGQGFHIAVLLTFGSDKSLPQENIPRVIGQSAASLASTHQIIVGLAPPSKL